LLLSRRDACRHHDKSTKYVIGNTQDGKTEKSEKSRKALSGKASGDFEKVNSHKFGIV